MSQRRRHRSRASREAHERLLWRATVLLLVVLLVILAMMARG
jgi:hypothetical protein